MIERATILAGDGPILPEHLPSPLPARGKSQQAAPTSRSAALTSRSPREPRPFATSR